MWIYGVRPPGRGTMKEKGRYEKGVEREMGEMYRGAGSFAPWQFLILGD